jgi:hypothetical protein
VPFAQLLMLQRLAGNHAVAQLMAVDDHLPGALQRIPVAPADSYAERDADASAADLRVPELGDAPAARSPLASDAGQLVTPAAAGLRGRSGGLGGVRLHADDTAHRMTAALGAEAFTHGSDVFVSQDHYRPGTDAGSRLLAHELAHVAHARRSPSAAGQLHLKRSWKQLDFLMIKRKNITFAQQQFAGMLGPLTRVNKKLRTWATKVQSQDSYGHWWIESGVAARAGNPADVGGWKANRSWGWWPSVQVGLLQTVKAPGFRAPGVLNRGQRLDPDHGDEKVNDAFHPAMQVDDDEDGTVTAKRVIADVNRFATGFSGSWNWRLTWGKNCRTFQKRMMDSLGLRHQTAAEFTNSTGAGATGGPSAADWVLSRLMANNAIGKANAIPALDEGNAELLLATGIAYRDWEIVAANDEARARVLSRLGLTNDLRGRAALDGALEKAYFEGQHKDSDGHPAPLRLFRDDPQQPLRDAARISTELTVAGAFMLGKNLTDQQYANALPDTVSLADYQALNAQERAVILRRVGCTADQLNAALSIKFTGGDAVDLFV